MTSSSEYAVVEKTHCLHRRLLEKCQGAKAAKRKPPDLSNNNADDDNEDEDEDDNDNDDDGKDNNRDDDCKDKDEDEDRW